MSAVPAGDGGIFTVPFALIPSALSPRAMAGWKKCCMQK